MARPQKNGLDYFPLDVDMDQDDKVALIEAQHGIVGFAIVVKLLMKIYKNSYFYEWTEKEQLLFSKRVNVDINRVNVIINDCAKWGLFNGDMLKTYKILTSEGVQRRYLEAVGRRQKVKMYKEYLLLNQDTVNVYKNLIIVYINGINDNINPQSKVKESKVKKSKENNNSNDNVKKSYVEFFNNNFHLITKFELETLNSFEKDGLNEEVIILALEKAVENGVRTINYVKTILHSWLENNIKTVEEVKTLDKEFKRRNNKERNKNGAKIDGFNSYGGQREYDFDDLEKKLLGY
ncbi:Lin1244/Lin1753 domain-containing protein [Clostridium rectalis]|uniref:Lin1244/Lin1753 domain-containing protein n=1 Tax=Clostridium rectalis TaxID=2040295 RepID=UPI001FA9A142|nr:Lin1244/Lin1753 domain-containing protein [Clostridium rectalis]